MEFIGYKSGHFPFKLTHSACMSLQSFLKESKMHAAATLIKTYMFPIYEKFVVFFSNLCNASNLLGMRFFQLNFFF